MIERMKFSEKELKCFVKDCFMELNKRLENFHDKTEEKGATMIDKILRNEEMNIEDEYKLNFPDKFKFYHKYLPHLKRQRGIYQVEMNGEVGSAFDAVI